ncbi:fungal-specific transcription factor domain-containing protein [Aspergillus filifer]
MAVDADEAATKPTPTVSSRLNRFCQEIQSTPDIFEELEEHLITLYFTWEQSWCQLVDEHLFRESMQNKGRYFSPLLMNCILALGSRYSDRLEVLSAPHDHNTAGQTFLDIAEVLLHFDLQYPSITTIQSLGVLAMMYVAIGSDSKGWLCHGMTVRLALDMGFNLECAALNKFNVLPDAEINLRRQIYWALYYTDKTWASYTGRACTMLDSQASVKLPLPTVTG